jgi:hypothetical protein
MGISLAATLPKSFLQEPSPQRLNPDVKTFLGQFLARECGSEIAIAFLIGPQDFGSQCGMMLVVGGLASQSVNDSRIAAFFEFALDASDVSDAEFEESCGFGLRPFAIQNRLHRLENVTLTLTHLDTVPVLYLDHLASSSA